MLRSLRISNLVLIREAELDLAAGLNAITGETGAGKSIVVDALLLIAGGRDHIAPASVTKANYKLYSKSKAVTEYKEYPDRSHFTVGQPGWEQVADFALEWSVEHARMQLPVAPLPDTLRPSAEPEMRA